MPYTIAIAAGLLLLTSGGIAVWQRRARTCSLHRRWIGRVAWVLAGLCAGAGVALLVALTLWR